MGRAKFVGVLLVLLVHGAFDEAGAAPKRQEAPPVQFGNWHLRTVTDSMTDEVTHVLVTTRNADIHEPSRLAVTCDSGSRRIFLSTTNGYWISSRPVLIAVTYRVDAGKAVRGDWYVTKPPLSQSADVLGSPLYDAMRSGRRVLFRVSAEAADYEGAFDISGARAALKELDARCRRQLRK